MSTTTAPSALQRSMIEDLDPDVRIQAVLELAESPGDEVAAALVQAMGTEPEFAIRETLTWALGRMPEEATPYLHDALRSEHWLARMQALHVLSKWGRATDAEFVVELVADAHPLVAARACWAAGQTRNPAVIPVLIGALGRGDEELRNTMSSAFSALGRAGVDALAVAVRSPGTVASRVHAADTLAYLGTSAADPATLALAETAQDARTEPEVRFAALNALGRLPSTWAERVLQTMSGASDALLADLARRLLTKRGEQIDDLTYLTERTGATRLQARMAMRDHHGDRTAALGSLRAVEVVPLAHGTIAAGPGALVELLTASDLTATSQAFVGLAGQLAALAGDGTPDSRGEIDPELLLAGEVGGRPVRTAIADLAEATGEPVRLGRVLRLPGHTATHLLGPGPTHRVAALASVTGGTPERRDLLAMITARQVAEADPRWTTAAEVPTETTDRVRRRAGTDLGGIDVPQRRLDSAVVRYLQQTVLLEQPSVSELGLRIADHFRGTGVEVTDWVRLELGRAHSG